MFLLKDGILKREVVTLENEREHGVRYVMKFPITENKALFRFHRKLLRNKTLERHTHACQFKP